MNGVKYQEFLEKNLLPSTISCFIQKGLEGIIANTTFSIKY